MNTHAHQDANSVLQHSSFAGSLRCNVHMQMVIGLNSTDATETMHKLDCQHTERKRNAAGKNSNTYHAELSPSGHHCCTYHFDCLQGIREDNSIRRDCTLSNRPQLLSRAHKTLRYAKNFQCRSNEGPESSMCASHLVVGRLHPPEAAYTSVCQLCLLYTSDAADE